MFSKNRSRIAEIHILGLPKIALYPFGKSSIELKILAGNVEIETQF